MSDLYIPLALIGTFAAVALGAMAIQASYSGRRRTLGLLRSQVPQVDMRSKELSEPFLKRVVVPFATGLGQAAKRITPIGMRDRIARKLVLAGSPPGLDAEKVAAFKVFGAIGTGIAAFALAKLGGASPAILTIAPFFGAALGYLVPGAGLGQKAINRQEAMRRALPDTIDLLAVSVEAGLGFDAALSKVRQNVPGPLSDEFGRMLQEMQLGVGRTEAMKGLAERTDIEELKGFILAMTQADAFGISVGSVLRAQAKELRVKRRQRAEEQGMKIPVKLLFPLIFCLLPAMFVVLVGPGIIKILRAFTGLDF